MRRRRAFWLLAAVALLALAAALMWTGRPQRAAKEGVEFPTYLRPDEWERLNRRKRDLQVLAAQSRQLETAARDPLLVALSGAAARGSSMVFEIAALADTPIGRMVVDCLERRPDEPFAEVRREAGFDPGEAVDRVAVADDLLVIGGDFAGVGGAPAFAGMARSARGDAVVFTPKDGGERLAIWRDELLIVAKDDEALAEALGLLGGEIPYDEGVIPESETYGEIHGTLDVDEVAELIGDADLARRFGEAADEVSIHVDASDDVAIAADVSGGAAEPLDDLARAVGGAMAVARMQAIADDEDALAELLDYASVDAEGGRMQIEIALPREFLERQLRDCKWMQ